MIQVNDVDAPGAGESCDMTTRATFVVPVNDDVVCERNFLASPFLRHGHAHDVLLQRGFASAALGRP